MLVDSVGPIVGGAFGASSATTYIESGAGVSAGGRTGIVAITVGLIFLFVPFLTPIISIVPPQATAAALIIVGFFMIQSLGDINWTDFRIAFPVLITMITMPLTYSITNGIGFGFITFTAMHALHRRRTQSPLAHVRGQRGVHHLLPCRAVAGVDRGALDIRRKTKEICCDNKKKARLASSKPSLLR